MLPFASIQYAYQVDRARELPTAPSYDDLLRENQDLKLSLGQIKLSAPYTSSASSAIDSPSWEKYVYSELKSSTAGIEVSWSNIILPSRQLSLRLLHHDKLWNSWVHYGLQYPQFEQEHEDFWSGLEAGGLIQDCDPSWLALYFAVLTTALLSIADEELANISLPQGMWLVGVGQAVPLTKIQDQDDLTGIWYATSLFCLNRADFLRRFDVRTVQTIVILGMCFLNFGDVDLSRTLWGAAIRIAQSLGLDKRTIPEKVRLDPELCHRMWWTLIIVEW